MVSCSTQLGRKPCIGENNILYVHVFKKFPTPKIVIHDQHSLSSWSARSEVAEGGEGLVEKPMLTQLKTRSIIEDQAQALQEIGGKGK